MKKIMKSPTRDEVISILRERLDQHPEILFAYLFGSVIEVEQFRDVDVAVYVDPQHYPEDWMTYMFGLGDELSHALHYPTDVVLMSEAPDHLIHSIAKGTVLVDRDEHYRFEWIERALSRYFDYQPSRRRAVADLFT